MPREIMAHVVQENILQMKYIAYWQCPFSELPLKIKPSTYNVWLKSHDEEAFLAGTLCLTNQPGQDWSFLTSESRMVS